MKKTFKLLLMLLIPIAMVNCDLDENIVDTFGEEDPFAGGGDAPNPCTGDVLGSGGITHTHLTTAYGTLFSSGTANHGGYWSVQHVSSDAMAIPAKGGDWFDGGIWVNMHRHTYSPTNGPLNDAFVGQYNALNEVNTALASEANPQFVAELRVLRAYYYARLLDTYGRVKIITTPGVDAPQATRQQVYDFVVSELNAAIDSGNLLAIPANNAMISESAARGVLAKVYLNAEVYTGTANWAGVITQTDAIINTGNYNLEANYRDAFKPDNDNSTENIWVTPFDQTTGTGFNIAQMTLHYGSQQTFNLDAQPWNGYAALEEFYNSYDNTDDRKANNFLVGPQETANGEPIIDFASETTDPDLQLNYTPAINEVFPNANREGGARLFKFNFAECQRPNMNNDYPLVRYADVLLMKAEAEARTAGDWSNATTLGLVNQVRTRAGLSVAGSLTADTFLAERGREMFMETTRRSDLIRYGKWGDAWWEKDASSSDHLTMFPIPQAQIDASQTSANQLTQNPGY
jgi:hypothetical protein